MARNRELTMITVIDIVSNKEWIMTNYAARFVYTRNLIMVFRKLRQG